MSVKVAVRVRPFNQREKDNNSELCIGMEGPLTYIYDELGKEKKFTFDYSFWSHDGFVNREDGYSEAIDDKYYDQMRVFECLGKEILDNAWEGYHCCLFAYGQTGSGKSYSMVGYGKNKGIVPISCEEIFKRISENKNENLSFEVLVSMLEIYNEKIQDLLVPINKRPQLGLKVRESKILGIYVEGLSKYPVTSYEEIASKMDEGYDNRTIGSTQMNATSSRAHTIVTIEFKQIQKIAGKKAEKISVINLVDLAGSERANSTGATGDRLKEGCNINKSLLVLGNVINTLADKATGKKKDILPPYRDSALTRILQNALGGNSKTVMICALSPASINYEETLSTLRYADRAKKIQNKAVVNESEHDKMVRMLKEENNDLKKMIEELNKKIMGGGGLLEEDSKHFLDLKEQLEANSKVMLEMEKPFELLVQEAKTKEKEYLGEKVDTNFPHFEVLNEDSQLSRKLKYSLKELPVYIGRKHGNPQPQIVLAGIGIKTNHAKIIKEGENFILQSVEEGSRDYIFINGKKLTSNEISLKHQDRITFGTNSIFLFLLDAKSPPLIDWETAHIELQREFEETNKKIEKENEKKKFEEMEIIKKNIEDQYAKEKLEIESRLKSQLIQFEEQMKEINQMKEKANHEENKHDTKKELESKLKENEEKLNKKKKEEVEYQLKKKNTENPDEKLTLSLRILVKKLNKMKIICSELKRNVNMEALIEINQANNEKEIFVRVENFEQGTVYYWNTDTFYNRYQLMKEQFEKFFDEALEIKIDKDEDDPLWDKPKPRFLGFSYYKLKPLAYLIDNPSSLRIVNSKGKHVCTVSVNIHPLDEKGQVFNGGPVENPYDLIGISLKYKIIVSEITNLPEFFSKNVKIEYENFSDKVIYTANAKNEFPTTNIVLNQEFIHKIDYVTHEDIDSLISEKICFKVYAFEEIEKKGRTLMEVRRTIVQNEVKRFESPKKILVSNTKNNPKFAERSRTPTPADKKESDKNKCLII